MTMYDVRAFLRLLSLRLCGKGLTNSPLLALHLQPYAGYPYHASMQLPHVPMAVDGASNSALAPAYLPPGVAGHVSVYTHPRKYPFHHPSIYSQYPPLPPQQQYQHQQYPYQQPYARIQPPAIPPDSMLGGHISSTIPGLANGSTPPARCKRTSPGLRVETVGDRGTSNTSGALTRTTSSSTILSENTHDIHPRYHQSQNQHTRNHTNPKQQQLQLQRLHTQTPLVTTTSSTTDSSWQSKPSPAGSSGENLKDDIASASSSTQRSKVDELEDGEISPADSDTYHATRIPEPVSRINSDQYRDNNAVIPFADRMKDQPIQTTAFVAEFEDAHRSLARMPASKVFPRSDIFSIFPVNITKAFSSHVFESLSITSVTASYIVQPGSITYSAEYLIASFSFPHAFIPSGLTMPKFSFPFVAQLSERWQFPPQRIFQPSSKITTFDDNPYTGNNTNTKLKQHINNKQSNFSWRDDWNPIESTCNSVGPIRLQNKKNPPKSPYQKKKPNFFPMPRKDKSTELPLSSSLQQPHYVPPISLSAESTIAMSNEEGSPVLEKLMCVYDDVSISLEERRAALIQYQFEQ